MKIGSVETPGSLWVTVSDGICRSGRVCHLGGLGGAGRCARAPEAISPSGAREGQPDRADPGGAKQLAAGQVWVGEVHL